MLCITGYRHEFVNSAQLLPANMGLGIVIKVGYILYRKLTGYFPTESTESTLQSNFR